MEATAALDREAAAFNLAQAKPQDRFHLGRTEDWHPETLSMHVNAISVVPTHS